MSDFFKTEKELVGNKSNHPLYKTWRGMIRRCDNTKGSSYKYYSGRGITVCDKWINSFSAFIFDMGRKPTDQHQLDRIDNDKGYEPGNCRWATPSENCYNRSTSFGNKINEEKWQNAMSKIGFN
jgi:hypothetical protein